MERTIGWTEVFVYAVTQTVSLAHEDLSWAGVGHAVVVFWLVWWAWTQYTWALNSADTTLPAVDAVMLVATAIALPGGGRYLLSLRPMAESAPHAGAHAGLYGGDGDAYDLRHHAAHDALVFLLALPGSQVAFGRDRAQAIHRT